MSTATADEARLVLESQPRLWIEAMLEEHDRCQMDEARRAILARIGAVLFNTFGSMGVYDDPDPS